MKRTWFGLAMLGLGTFLLVAGIVCTTWAPGVVKRTPLDIDQTTHLTGTVKKLDPLTDTFEEQPVKVESISQVDSEASDDETVVFVQSQCVVIDINDAPGCVDGEDPRLVDAGTDVFATDRLTAMAVPDYPGLPADALPREGLQNKWPFDAEKTTYPFWDNTMETTNPAVYDRTETLAGIEVYVYVTTISDAPITIGDLDGRYDNVVENWIEPRTGAIQQQTQDQQRYLDDGTQVLDLKVGFTDEQIQTFAADTEDNLRLLNLVTVWVPTVGFVGGTLCLLAGLALILTGRRREGSDSEPPVLADVSA